MADTLTDAHHRAQAARAAGHDQLPPEVVTDIRRRYRGATTAGISDNRSRAGPLAADARTLARRFRTQAGPPSLSCSVTSPCRQRAPTCTPTSSSSR